MLDKEKFLTTYRNKDKFEKSGLDWDNLYIIFQDYVNRRQDFESTGKYIADCLSQVDSVHSLKMRTKDPEHLLEKIIRKKSSDQSIDFTVCNYGTQITDLVGVRVLHLFKEDWKQIHDFIKSRWDLYEDPTANIRAGDSDDYIAEFISQGCEIKKHKFGYRSVHYLVKSSPGREEYIAEIQVRTIFEEGWSEIDHKVRYPYEVDNELLNQYLSMFNRLAGSADEMGTFVKHLKEKITDMMSEIRNSKVEKDKAISELNEIIQKMEIKKEVKEELKGKIETVIQNNNVWDTSKLAARLLDAGAFDTSKLASKLLDASAFDTSKLASKLLDANAFDTSKLASRLLDARAFDTSKLASKLLDANAFDTSKLASRLLDASAFDASKLASGVFDKNILGSSVPKHEISKVCTICGKSLDENNDDSICKECQKNENNNE